MVENTEQSLSIPTTDREIPVSFHTESVRKDLGVDREGAPDQHIFTSLSPEQAEALFLPRIAHAIVDSVAASPIVSAKDTNQELTKRLTTEMRFPTLREALAFNMDLQYFLAHPEDLKKLLVDYRQAVVRNDPVGPFDERLLEWVKDYTHPRPSDLEWEGKGRRFIAENFHRINTAVGQKPSTSTGPYNEVLDWPSKVMGDTAKRLLRELMGQFPEGTGFAFRREDMDMLKGRILDYCKHPDLTHADLELQQKLLQLAQSMTGISDPHGFLREVERFIHVAASREATQVRLKTLLPVLDIEWLARSTNYSERMRNRGYNLTTPGIVEGEPRIEIVNGIAPSLALIKPRETITPHTVHFDEATRILGLVGPNNSGKSTLERMLVQNIVAAQQGQFALADSMRLFPVTDVEAGLQVARGPERGSFHRQDCDFVAATLKKAQGQSPSEKPGTMIIAMDDIWQQVQSTDAVPLLLATLRYLQDKKNVIVIFASHVHPAIDQLERYGIRARIVHLDQDSHQMEEGAQESKAFAIAERVGLEPEILDIAKQLRAKEGEEKILLELPPPPERKPQELDFVTDKETLGDLGLTGDTYPYPVLKMLFNACHPTERAPTADIDEKRPAFEAWRAFREFFTTYSKDKEKQLQAADVLENHDVLKSLDAHLRHLERIDGGKDRYNGSKYKHLYEVFKPEIPYKGERRDEYATFEEYQDVFSIFTGTSNRDVPLNLRSCMEKIVADPSLAFLHPDAKLVRQFIDSSFIAKLKQLTATHPDAPKQTRVGKFLSSTGLYRDRWQSNLVQRCGKHEKEIRQFRRALESLTSTVTLANAFRSLPFVKVEEVGTETRIAGGLNVFLPFSRVEKPYSLEGYQQMRVLSIAMFDLMKQMRNIHFGSPQAKMEFFIDYLTSVSNRAAIAVDQAAGIEKGGLFNAMLALHELNKKIIPPRLVDIPVFLDSERITALTGPTEGGKSMLLYQMAQNTVFEQSIGRVLGASGQRRDVRFLLTALHPMVDTETEGSLLSEFTRCRDLIKRYQKLGEPTNGEVYIDEPVAPKTSYQEAKYFVAALAIYFARRGVRFNVATHCIEALHLLDKVDGDYAKYVAASVTSPYGKGPYQLRIGVAASEGIETARHAGIANDVIVDAYRIQEELYGIKRPIVEAPPTVEMFEEEVLELGVTGVKQYLENPKRVESFFNSLKEYAKFVQEKFGKKLLNDEEEYSGYDMCEPAAQAVAHAIKQKFSLSDDDVTVVNGWYKDKTGPGGGPHDAWVRIRIDNEVYFVHPTLGQFDKQYAGKIVFGDLKTEKELGLRINPASEYPETFEARIENIKAEEGEIGQSLYRAVYHSLSNLYP